MIHEIRFHDEQGRITLAEFLRLAGLVAVDAADPGDLAIEFVTNEVTLHLDPDQMTDRRSYDWYEASFRAYWLGCDAAEQQGRTTYEQAHQRAVDAWLVLIEQASMVLLDAAGTAQVNVIELAPLLAAKTSSANPL